MYLIDTLYYIYKPVKREAMINASKRISQKENVSRIKVALDMIYCSFIYGATFTEYDDLDFFYRTKANRKSFITTFYNFKLYNKINNKHYRDVFHNKIMFLEKFNDFIKRDWINLNIATDSQISEFLSKHDQIVMKASYGDSGKEVVVYQIPNDIDLTKFKKYFKQNHFDLAEECIKNHPEISKFNASSLNTLRIVTVNNGKNVNILFAGLRVGGKGAKIDNISQGGAVARINIVSGIIDSSFYTKRSSYNSGDTDFDSPLGSKIPFWDQVKQLVTEAALVVPEIGIVAWDIAITNNTIDIIEGNESFGSVIMQLYYTHEEEGLKPTLLKLL